MTDRLPSLWSGIGNSSAYKLIQLDGPESASSRTRDHRLTRTPLIRLGVRTIDL